MPWSGAKVSNHLLSALASDEARTAGVDEALLLDREGYLVEGSRSNLVVVTRSGETTTQDPSRGGVAGVGVLGPSVGGEPVGQPQLFDEIFGVLLGIEALGNEQPQEQHVFILNLLPGFLEVWHLCPARWTGREPKIEHHRPLADLIGKTETCTVEQVHLEIRRWFWRRIPADA